MPSSPATPPPNGAAPNPDTGPDAPPPFLRTWGRVYLAICLYLVILIALFDLFTRSLNR
jgi:hypothetical protein